MKIFAASKTFLCLLLFAFPAASSGQPDDAVFDLRDYFGDGTMVSYITAVRNQSWGTCWIHGTCAAMESNLKMNGSWSSAGMGGEPDLAEYHMDKFNGFNRKGEPDDEPYDGWYTGQKDPFPGSNLDEPLESRTHGVIVHLGGDYRIAGAYLTNHGAVNETNDTEVWGYYPEKRIQFGYGDDDGIPRTNDAYHYFIPSDIEWHTLYGTDTEKRERIKRAVVDHGAVATCMYWGGNFYSSGIHYQPPSDSREPNHAIAIVGWDDQRLTQAPQPGAWLCRNSWGSAWNGSGYFWISYYDKHTARHPEMGGVTFRGVQEKPFDRMYSHSLHGWQYDTGSDAANITGAANRFVAPHHEDLVSVGIYTLAENAHYTIRVYETLGADETLIAQESGAIQRAGFHLIDLDPAVRMHPGEDYFIALELDRGGYAFDASFRVYTAMGMGPDLRPEPVPYEDFYKFDQISDFFSAMGTITDPPYDVYSKARPDESFYKDASGQWRDFHEYDAHGRLGTEWNDQSWNFTITGYAVAAANACDGDLDDDGDVDGKDLAGFIEDLGDGTGDLGDFSECFGRADCY